MTTVFVKKVLCPNPLHSETTPSCAVYSDGSGFCFGCNTYFKSIEEPKDIPLPKPENLEDKLKYIESLPILEHRGLAFPYDNEGYYVVWPDKSFYKRRNWPGPEVPKYTSPRGHTKPWFILTNGTETSTKTSAIVVEGEINALSIGLLDLPYHIMSPGSATNFHDRFMRDNLYCFEYYSTIVLIADSDAAGFEAVIKLKQLIQPYVTDVSINLMEEDCNNILVTYGKERLKEELKKMGL